MPLPQHIRAVLFDWDGTLADSISLVARATNDVLVANGHPEVTEANIHDGMRFPTAERMAFHLSRPFEGPTMEYARDLAAQFYARSEEIGEHYIELFPGVRKMLARIDAAALQMALVTNNRGSTVRGLVHHLGYDRELAIVVAEEDVSLPKPDPQGIALALKQIGVAASEAIYVGDSRTDAGAARNAGVHAAGATWPRDSVAHVDPDLFDSVFATPSDLADAVCARSIQR